MTMKTIKVEGMSCGHCVETIKTAVSGLEGVQSVEVDLEKKEVTVNLDDEAKGLEMVSDKIVEVGFEVVGS